MRGESERGICFSAVGEKQQLLTAKAVRNDNTLWFGMTTFCGSE
jgi:hypothetical protein